MGVTDTCFQEGPVILTLNPKPPKPYVEGTRVEVGISGLGCGSSGLGLVCRALPLGLRV